MNKGIYLLICFFAVLFLFLTIDNSLAKYTDMVEATPEVEVALWNVKVNDSYISQSNTFELKDLSWKLADPNSGVSIEDGYIGPGMVGSFIVDLDPNDSEVAIEYSIKIDTSDLEGINLNLKDIFYINEDGTEISYKDKFVNYEYKGEFTLEQIQNGEHVKLRVDVEWPLGDSKDQNDENNKKDTEVGMIVGNTIDFPVEIVASQKVGVTE